MTEREELITHIPASAEIMAKIDRYEDQIIYWR